MTTTAPTLPPLRDPTAFVKAMAKVAKALGEDLVARAKDTRIEPSLRQSYDDEKAAGRTGEDFLTWRNAFCDQVAASWVLCTVFVRTLEDRGFLRHRIAGPGAADRLAQFQRMFRFLSERDYLRHIFDALAEPPPSWPRDRPADEWVGAQVFGRTSAPLWRLSPSAGALSTMLDALRAIDAEGVPVFTFGRPEGVDHDGSTTRFLGDLYQDLNEGVRKRYGLLQTPDFVEGFILDQTLTPALQERGVAVTVCDPTCGSGHFLLGAYDRLFETRTRQEPGRSATERARQALSQVYGIDLNPYAVAIARFRLLVSFLDKAGLSTLDEMPTDLQANTFVGDSLLAGKAVQGELGEATGEKAFGRARGFSLVDQKTHDLLKATRFDVIVGNPPFGSEPDAAKRRLIASLYRSAAGQYTLVAPFIERFFELAIRDGFVGQVTANSFTTAKWGRKVIEDVFPSFEISNIIDVRYANLANFGLPPLIFFGRKRSPPSNRPIKVVRGKRGSDTATGSSASHPVWETIARSFNVEDYSDNLIEVVRASIDDLKTHPWTMLNADLDKDVSTLLSKASIRLTNLCSSIGLDTITRASELMEQSIETFRRWGVEEDLVRPIICGSDVRDWRAEPEKQVILPYTSGLELIEITSRPGLLKALWPHRSWLERRFVSGGTRLCDVGLPFWAMPQLPVEKHRDKSFVVFSEMATHNHFVGVDGDVFFKQTAPIIKLHTNHLTNRNAIISMLNSSAAAYFFRGRSVKLNDKIDGARESKESWSERVVFKGTVVVQELPIPDFTVRLNDLGKAAADTARRLVQLSPRCIFAESRAEAHAKLTERLKQAEIMTTTLQRKLVALQEEVDWVIYKAFGFVSITDDRDVDSLEPIDPNQRPFEIMLARSSSTVATTTTWFQRHSRAPMTEAIGVGTTTKEKIEGRMELLARENISHFERPEFKRRWEFQDWHQLVRVACVDELMRLAEGMFKDARGTPRALSVRQIAASLAAMPEAPALHFTLDATTGDWEALIAAIVSDASVPSSTSRIYSESGIEKRRTWEESWRVQREQDLNIPVDSVVGLPYVFSQERKVFDYQNHTIWGHRGSMDIPTEAFIAYPSATPPAGSSGAAGLVVGWAGWTHLEQLQAAIALWQDEWGEHGNKLVPRATREALEEGAPAAALDQATRTKLLPILQTMVDLLVWVRQWHNDDGETADEFDSYVDEQCRLVEMSREQVHLWRMPAAVKKAAAKKKTPKKKATTTTADDE